MSKPALVIQHFVADAPYFLADALGSAHVDMDLRRVDKGDDLPSSLEGHAALIVLGGPASAAQSSVGYPTLATEVRLFTEAYESEKPALGVCLGAQVLARAGGAKVYAGRAGKEIGWMPIQVTAEGSTAGPLSQIGDELTVFQWHGDTFDLPAGARLLAGSDAYPNQAFQWGSCLGLQPHLEVDSIDGVRAFLQAFREEAGTVEGGAEAILRSTPEALRRSENSRSIVLSKWAQAINLENILTIDH